MDDALCIAQVVGEVVAPLVMDEHALFLFGEPASAFDCGEEGCEGVVLGDEGVVAEELLGGGFGMAGAGGA